MPDYGSREMKMTAEDVVLMTNPEIMGNVVYHVGFKVSGSSQNFEVEITDVDVQDIKNPVYNDNGDPVMVANEADKQRFIQTAYDYFWKHLVDKAEAKAIDQVQWGQA